MRKIYSYEECKERALRYNTRKSLKENEPGIYNKINSKKWGNELFSHMKRLDHREIQYTKEMCKEKISQYEYLKEFREKEPRLYALIHSHKWGDLLSTLKKTGSANERFIYVYEFPEFNAAYVGLTYNIDVRNKEHHLRGKLFQWAKSHEITQYSPITLKEHVPFDEAGAAEDYYIKKYEKGGWHLINKAKAGSLGGMMLKNDEIVLFSEKGDYLDKGKVKNISEKYGIKINLIRICLNKRNKTTGGYQILSKEEWENLGNPNIIEDKTDISREREIAILDLDFNLEHVSKNKMEARKYLKLKSSLNCVTYVTDNLICNFGCIPQKWVCYYDDYKRYRDGEWMILNPRMPKNKHLCFVPSISSPEEQNEIVERCFTRKKWKERALERKRVKNKK